jgi:hypothetical protein
LTTQIDAAELAWKSRAMVGSATFVIVLSSTDMQIESRMAAMAQ